jgi:hypothetical protein
MCHLVIPRDVRPRSRLHDKRTSSWRMQWLHTFGARGVYDAAALKWLIDATHVMMRVVWRQVTLPWLRPLSGACLSRQWPTSSIASITMIFHSSSGWFVDNSSHKMILTCSISAKVDPPVDKCVSLSTPGDVCKANAKHLADLFCGIKMLTNYV